MQNSIELISKIKEQEKLKIEIEYVKKLISSGIPKEIEIGQCKED